MNDATTLAVMRESDSSDDLCYMGECSLRNSMERIRIISGEGGGVVYDMTRG